MVQDGHMLLGSGEIKVDQTVVFPYLANIRLAMQILLLATRHHPDLFQSILPTPHPETFS